MALQQNIKKMKKLNLLIFILGIFFLPSQAQINDKDLLMEEMKIDRLSPDFHQSRRNALRQLLPPKTLAIIFANPVRNRANDVDFVYHQNPDLYYLTGYKEPHSLLVLASEDMEFDQEVFKGEMLFGQARDPQAEMWNGKRLGKEGIQKNLGFKQVFHNEEFKDYDLQLDKYDQVYILNMRPDVNDTRADSDLYDLIQQFKEKAEMPADYNAVAERVYSLMQRSTKENHETIANQILRFRQWDKRLQKIAEVDQFLKAKTIEERQAILDKLPKNKVDGQTLTTIMATLREVKVADELEFLRKAVTISCVGQNEVMKAMTPNMPEREIQGIHEFIFRKYGAEYQGYPSIVGAGNNGCILHYWESDKMQLGNDLVLMDLGAEYRGYTADVTRTIPASGKFSKEQKIIYDLVYNAQEAGIAACTVGNGFRAPDEAARAIINKGLAELGIIENEEAQHRYFPHGTSHYLGLDVHDPGEYGPFKNNTIITVEPGIYIPEGSPCDPKWWNIAVRIEDDILITDEGWENLSASSPRTTEEIEKMMAQESIFNQLKRVKIDD